MTAFLFLIPFELIWNTILEKFKLLGRIRNKIVTYYLINTPFFKKTVIHQENGKIFVIKAHNVSDKNKYIVAALLNGVRYEKAWIEHNNIVKGRELILEMGAVPSAN
jgi:putative alpha-1,2-mannosidase